VRRLDAALELSREEELHDAPVAPFKALLTRNSVGAMQRRRRAAALQGASRIFMVSGRSSAAEHQRLLWNRRFHPFHVYTEKKRREKLNYAERHKLWHGRPARDHGRDGRATKGCTITRSGAGG